MAKRKGLGRKKCECGENLIFLPGLSGKFVPVEMKSLSESDNFEIGRGYTIAFQGSRHVNHFTTCEFARNYSKSKKPYQSSNLFPPAPYKDDPEDEE